MSDASSRIAALIREGRKIEAIKLLRETTGVDLKHAREEVERLSQGLSGQAPPLLPSGAGSEAAGRPGTISQEVADLARQGKKIEAIKLLREQTGVGLKEAKERIEAETGTKGGGCMPVLLLVLLAGAATVVATIAAVVAAAAGV